MYKHKRIIALTLAAILALSFAFSSLFIVLEANHDCTRDEDCEICQQIDICLHLFKDFSPDPNTAVYSAPIIFSVVLLIGFIMMSKTHNTLINLKVKLSN